jgi:hypothetical protein
VVRAIGSDLHMDYTAVGQTTHLAALLIARPELGAALDLYQAMDMAFWLPQVEAVLAQAEER